MPRCRLGLPVETRLDGGRRRVLCWLHAETGQPAGEARA
jgi:hypothetical protein